MSVCFIVLKYDSQVDSYKHDDSAWFRSVETIMVLASLGKWHRWKYVFDTYIDLASLQLQPAAYFEDCMHFYPQKWNVIRVLFIFSKSTEDKPNEAPPPRPKGFRPLYDIPWMFEAREFLRKKLIGKKVNVVVDYIQTAKDNFPEKVCCTVTIGGMWVLCYF